MEFRPNGSYTGGLNELLGAFELSSRNTERVYTKATSDGPVASLQRVPGAGCYMSDEDFLFAKSYWSKGGREALVRRAIHAFLPSKEA